MTSWRHSSAAMRRMACSLAPLWHALGNVCARRPGAAAAPATPQGRLPTAPRGRAGGGRGGAPPPPPAPSTTHARLTTAPRVRHSWRLSRVPARQHENNP
ncbi:hypothetical protein EGJ83_02765 [Pseudomonas aeruginosa]|nr:hypothetical protein EGJ83_02765 [Pseudomonas aeruginosa]